MFANWMTAALVVLAASPMLASAAPAPPNPNNQLQKRDPVQIVNNCIVNGQVALTFDDGPFLYETDIGNALGGSKATFFLNGNNYDCIYNHVDEIRALSDAGHTFGSHGWSHKDMGQLSWDEVHDELWRVEEAFIRILGFKPIYFRPPYGSISDTLLAALENRGYKKVFLWSEDTGDSLGASVDSQEGVYNGIADSYPSPHLVLNHSPLSSTAFETVPYAVNLLKNRGYQLVAVDTCMGSQGEWPYQF
ncbi:hypothetical protein QFC19_000447 [Naganishia cerealis]|uniref:Uncharacterized protein n=1 Tax=Naganishia cerealis TaxID=610337 RepID=A0ACC2WQR8_9TREE|nr:hypothetical protein QFC19_000447 [Naganishia cerealis]